MVDLICNEDICKGIIGHDADGNYSAITADYTVLATGGIGGLFASLQNAATTVANEAAKNMKVCAHCGEPTTADKTFCPSCGAALSNMAIAPDGRVIPCQSWLNSEASLGNILEDDFSNISTPI